jgi:Na+/citrate or Na+/malate symporter
MAEFLASLPAPLRHLILLLISAGLGWVGADLIPALNDQAGYGVLLASVIAAVLAYVTPLVNSYGVGKTTVNR